jgi:hypothetical protein
MLEYGSWFYILKEKKLKFLSGSHIFLSPWQMEANTILNGGMIL